MTISQLIQVLTTIQTAKGDLSVVLRNPNLTVVDWLGLQHVEVITITESDGTQELAGLS